MTLFRELPRIAVISDIHANAHALRAALEVVARKGCDRLILLGDLFTYGCRPAEVFALVRRAIHLHNAIVIKGNHDDMYIRRQQERKAEFPGLPDWLRESVNWTADQLADIDVASALPWRESIQLADVHFAHANPFGFGDWSYMEGRAALALAAATLAEDDVPLGVFGHTHRRLVAQCYSSGAVKIARDSRVLAMSDEGQPLAVIANPGSIGQPRGPVRQCSLMLLSAAAGQLSVEFVDVVYDQRAHLDAILDSSLGEATQQKLISYFETSAATTAAAREVVA